MTLNVEVEVAGEEKGEIEGEEKRRNRRRRRSRNRSRLEKTPPSRNEGSMACRQELSTMYSG